MKVALVHDYLNQYGGAERVLETLMDIFPNAPIYTLLYDKERTYGKFEGRVKKTSFLDFGLIRRNHRLFIPLMPLATQMMRVEDEYDLIISSSAGYAKGVAIKQQATRDKRQVKHVSYCHTPLRYAWEPDYLSGVISNYQLSISKPVLNYLRKWDYNAGQKPDILIANSNFIAGKIKKYYNRDATVVYPPVDLNVFCPEPAKFHILNSKFYFMASGRFMHYKKFDLIIRAFNELRLPLKIVGSGPELPKLKKLAASSLIEFVDFNTDDSALRELYNGAIAFIFPQVEDFGLVAAEAIACGTPVIAYNAGGAKEIVNHGENGILFNEQTEKSLKNAIFEFSKYKFNPQKIADSAKKFSKEEFISKIKNVIQNFKLAKS